MSVLNLDLGSSGQTVHFCDRVLQHFDQHRQTRYWQRESGGQLFGIIAQTDILITDITGPRRSDRRTKVLYLPDREREQEEINERFSKGLHFMGDWHTHPEPHPTPSITDFVSMRECVTKSRHSLNAFLLVIVGSAGVPDGLHVSLHNGCEVLVLLGNASIAHEIES